jgi:8-oxo-dGTP diphosphatase
VSAFTGNANETSGRNEGGAEMDGLPPGDSRRYPKSPVVIAAVLVRKDDRVLLAKRGGEPYKGLWAPPGGSVELGETVFEAGKREVREETAIDIEIEGIQEIDDFIRHDAEGMVQAHLVIIRLLGSYVGGTARADSDADDVGWYSIDELENLPLRPGVRELAMRAMSWPRD